MAGIEMLSDGKDPRRTEIGNRIDPSLAKGFVNQMFKIAESQTRESSNRKIDLGHFNNPKGRMRAISKLKKLAGTTFISGVASPSYISAEFAVLAVGSQNGDRLMGALALRYDFRDQSKMPATHRAAYPSVSMGMSALLTEHAMIRMAQRGGARSFDDFVNLMKPFWAWASVAHEVRKAVEFDFYWFMPVSNGLIAIRTLYDSGPDRDPVIVSTAKTYIDCADMRPDKREIWERLTGLGILDLMPRFPRLSPPTQEQFNMLAAMMSEGAKWRNRLEYAVAKMSGDEPDPFK